MTDDHRHSVLAQIPLTVSPFINLPSAVTLPYTYRQLPPSLPPSSTTPIPPNVTPVPPQSEWGYIKSPSGASTTTPEKVIQLCDTLMHHLTAEREKAEAALRDWEKEIQDRELMEKRRVAPGYLDTGLRLLEPVKVHKEKPVEAAHQEEESELDKAFGKMAM